MSAEEFLPDFVKLSRATGRDLLLAQASGGNVSVKLDEHEFMIKASGCRLADVRPESGWLVSSREKAAPQASIESPMHRILPSRWVTHLHSIVGQLLGLMPEGERQDLLRGTLPEDCPVYVAAPASPGGDLGKEITAGLAQRPMSGGLDACALWLLQNHGLTWAAGTSHRVLELSAKLEYPLRHHFDLEEYGPLRDQGVVSENVPASPPGKNWHRVSLDHWPHREFDWQPLFPDYVGHFTVASGGVPDLVREDDAHVLVLSKNLQDFRNRMAILYAHALVSTVSRRCRWFRPLPALTVSRIRDMMYGEGSEGSDPSSRPGV